MDGSEKSENLAKTMASMKQTGQMSPKLLEMIAANVPCELIISKIHELLEARTPVRIGKGGDEYGGEPDYRAIEAGLKLFLNYTVGTPIARQHIIQETIETDSQTFSRIMESPAAYALMLTKMKVPDDVVQEMVRRLTAGAPVIEAETLGESSKE